MSSINHMLLIIPFLNNIFIINLKELGTFSL